MLILFLVKVIQPIVTRYLVYPSVCMSSVTLAHPAKAVRWNEMPFGRDTRVVPTNIVLDSGTVPPRKGEIWGVRTPSSH